MFTTTNNNVQIAGLLPQGLHDARKQRAHTRHAMPQLDCITTPITDAERQRLLIAAAMRGDKQADLDGTTAKQAAATHAAISSARAKRAASARRADMPLFDRATRIAWHCMRRGQSGAMLRLQSGYVQDRRAERANDCGAALSDAMDVVQVAALALLEQGYTEGTYRNADAVAIKAAYKAANHYIYTQRRHAESAEAARRYLARLNPKNDADALEIAAVRGCTTLSRPVLDDTEMLDDVRETQAAYDAIRGMVSDDCGHTLDALMRGKTVQAIADARHIGHSAISNQRGRIQAAARRYFPAPVLRGRLRETR